jgi:hypothetical protein
MSAVAATARRVSDSFNEQARAPDVLAAELPGARVAASDFGLVVWSLLLTLPVVALLRVLLPTVLSDDSVLYRALAEDPLDNPLIVESENKIHATFALRLLVPAIVWALPFDTDVGFDVTSMGGVLAGAVLVAVLARRLGLGRLALLAGPTYALTFHTIYGLHVPHHVDTVTLALFAGGVLAAYTYRAVLCALLATAVVASKEIGLALPLAWFAARRGERPIRRVLAETVAIGLGPLLLFLLMRYTQVIPHQSWQAWEQYKLGFTTQGEWGYVRPLVQVFLQNHGMLWLLWPLGVLVAPTRWRRFHLFVLLLIPFLAGGPWARSVGYLLPFVLPSALLVLARASFARAALALAASAAVAVPLSLRNIGMEEYGSNLLLVPGGMLFLVAALQPVRSVLDARRAGRVAAVGVS